MFVAETLNIMIFFLMKCKQNITNKKSMRFMTLDYYNNKRVRETK